MKVLRISDVHLRLNRVKYILDKWSDEVDHVIFLGDYADNWVENSDQLGTTDTETMFKWLKDNIKNPKYTFLLGNHDIAYVGGPIYVCPGWDPHKQDTISKIMTLDDWKQFQFFDYRDGILSTHAGLHPNLLPPYGLTDQWMDMKTAEIWESLQTNRMHYLMDCGFDRGGSAFTGGIIWLDWLGFEPIDDLNQIVGHTIRRRPEFVMGKGSQNWNFDTDNNHVIITEPRKEIQIKEVSS